MTVDLAALAKRHVESMTVLGRPTGHCAHCFDPEWPCNTAVLVRVALAAQAAANLIHMADWDPPTLHEAILRADSTLRSALADLDL